MSILPRTRFALTRARTHGAGRILTKRADSARSAARRAEEQGDTYFAAALRGKARGLSEAAAIIAALENDHALPKAKRDSN